MNILIQRNIPEEVLTPFRDRFPHHEIRVKESTWILLIRANPPDYCREVNDHIRIGIFKNPPDTIGINEIIVSASWYEDVSSTMLPHLVNKMRSEKTSSTSDEKMVFTPKTH